MESPIPQSSGFGRVLAFSVHIFTASGAAFALLALVAAIGGKWAEMFAWLGVALIVDAVDGTLARKLRVAERVPHVSGDILDLVVDYLGYVLVPALAIMLGGLLPPTFAVLAGAAILVSSAIYFADRRMKTEHWFFRGFPATWNLIAFYLFLLRPDPYLALGVVALFVALTFAPVFFVHPLRVKRLRPVNITLTGIWAALATYAVMRELTPPAAVTAGLCVIAVYFLFAGLLQPRRTRP